MGLPKRGGKKFSCREILHRLGITGRKGKIILRGGEYAERSRPGSKDISLPILQGNHLTLLPRKSKIYQIFL